MNIEWIETNGYRYLKVKIAPVYQKNKPFYVSRIPADFFIDVYTVEPAIYDVERETALAATFDTTENYFSYRLDTTNKRMQSGKFERKEDKKRVKEIAEWLQEEEYALFPNTIIVNCDLMNDLLNIGPNTKFNEIKDIINDEIQALCFLEEDNDPEEQYLYIPYNPTQFKSILVIDGQHRLEGLKNAGKDIQKNYELLVSFILGYNRAIVARQFYTINYEQKPVNKSLLYHLTGEFSTKSDTDIISFLHEVVRTLNEVEISPFFQRIKMLGVIDKERTPVEARKYLTISQAFLIDYLKNSISINTKASIYPPIFLYYFKKPDMQIEIVDFLIKYFQAIRNENIKSWDDPENSIICNTVSIGALIRVLNFIFVKMFCKEFNQDPTKMADVTVGELQSVLRGINLVDFRKEGTYGKSASGGSLNLLRQEILENISYFEHAEYDELLVEFKHDYLPIFWDFLKKVK